MSRYARCDLSCKVYVGNLGDTAGRRELEEAFMKFGPVKNVWVARNPPGFAFVEFEEPRDAQDACHALDDTTLCGHRAIVEMSNGEKRNRRGGRPLRSAGFDDKCYSCGEHGHFARDCKGGGRYGSRGRYGSISGSSSRRYGGRRSRSRSRDRSYSPRRYSDRSRSRSRSRRSRDRSYTPRRYSDRSRSRSPPRRSYTPRRHRSRSSSDRD